MRMGRTEMIVRLVVIAALLYFVYWTVFTNAGAGR
jgi:hypothetical protein